MAYVGVLLCRFFHPVTLQSQGIKSDIPEGFRLPASGFSLFGIENPHCSSATTSCQLGTKLIPEHIVWEETRCRA